MSQPSSCCEDDVLAALPSIVCLANQEQDMAKSSRSEFSTERQEVKWMTMMEHRFNKAIWRIEGERA
eukprot:3802738-Amphidinium_carterae.1